MTQPWSTVYANTANWREYVWPLVIGALVGAAVVWACLSGFHP
jgi:hypothetical protein